MAAAGAMALLALPATAGGDPTDVVRRAVARTLAAPYIAVEQRGQPQRLCSRTLMVCRRGGQVVLWTTAREEIRWNCKGRCYGRSTAFNRDDTRQMHSAIAPLHLRDIRAATRHGVPSTARAPRIRPTAPTPSTSSSSTPSAASPRSGSAPPASA